MLRKKQVKCGLGIGILGILIFASFGYASPLGTVKLGAAELGTHAQLGTPAEGAIVEQGAQIARQISNMDWLGPLAPIALSPFFGVAVLSGIATYGPDWLQQRSGLLGGSSPLNNEILFWVMATLAILTSIPRFSKVSKPISLAAEKLETYSVAIIFLSMKLFAQDPNSGSTPEIEVAIAGFSPIQLPMDIVMGLAAALNIIVINSIKLLIELLVWLTPIPFVDGLLEIANKGICAGLMSFYLYSPWMATILNLAIFAVCGYLFTRVARRIRLYRHLIVGPVLGWIWPSMFSESPSHFVGFVDKATPNLPRYTRLRVVRTSEGGWELSQRTWWKTSVIRLERCEPKIECGVFGEIVIFDDGRQPAIQLQRRHGVRSTGNVQLA